MQTNQQQAQKSCGYETGLTVTRMILFHPMDNVSLSLFNRRIIKLKCTMLNRDSSTSDLISLNIQLAEVRVHLA